MNSAARQRWLANPSVHRALQEFGARGLESGRAAIGRYVIMPDHLHLFVRLARDQELGLWVKALKAVLTRTTVPNAGSWQAGFFDHLLRQSESYAQKWEYVRMNPVRAGLVLKPEDWLFQGEIHELRFD